MTTNLNDCFVTAKKLDDKGKKHKGLLLVRKDQKMSEAYLEKAKVNLMLCPDFKKKRIDYMIEEAWYYTLYYCALAILSKFAIQTRSQRCTALFLRYVKEKGLIVLSDDFIDQITVHGDKEETSAVDEREEARYGASVQSEETMQKYDYMMDVCKKYISETEEIVYSDKDFVVPKELVK